MISGEPLPVEKEPGSQVVAATINGTGALLIRAERVGEETLLAKIVKLVGEAQRSRAPIERIVDRVARFFVPAVMLVSLATFIVWNAWGPEPRLGHAMVNAVAVLIIACPCALGLATPMAVMVGTGRGAEEGVLFRNAEALEILEKADTLVVDKTGTLTEGKPQLVALEAIGGFHADDVLRLAASLERGSEHPLAAAIVRAASEKKLPLTEARDFRSVTGKGVIGTVEGRSVVLGNAALLADLKIDAGPLQSRLAALREEGQTALVVAIDGRAAGVVGVADRIKESTPGSPSYASRGWDANHHAYGRQPADGRGCCPPTRDRRNLRRGPARSETRRRARAARRGPNCGDGRRRHQRRPGPGAGPSGNRDGDGDRRGARKAAVSITLVKGDLRSIARARALSRATIQNIRQNLFLAFFYNTATIPVAAGLLYPVLGIVISPIWASVAMEPLSSLSVVMNALRLREDAVVGLRFRSSRHDPKYARPKRTRVARPSRQSGRVAQRQEAPSYAGIGLYPKRPLRFRTSKSELRPASCSASTEIPGDELIRPPTARCTSPRRTGFKCM